MATLGTTNRKTDRIKNTFGFIRGTEQDEQSYDGHRKLCTFYKPNEKERKVMRLLIFILVLFAAVAVYTDTGVDFEDTKTIEELGK